MLNIEVQTKGLKFFQFPLLRIRMDSRLMEGQTSPPLGDESGTSWQSTMIWEINPDRSLLSNSPFYMYHPVILGHWVVMQFSRLQQSLVTLKAWRYIFQWISGNIFDALLHLNYIQEWVCLQMATYIHGTSAFIDLIVRSWLVPRIWRHLTIVLYTVNCILPGSWWNIVNLA